MNMEFLKSRLGKLSAGRILDVATGEGGFLETVISSFADYTAAIGIDNRDAGEEAFDKNFDDPHIDFKKMDASALDFPDACFDTVTICNSLHHMSDVKKVLSEVLRVLKPGGLFIAAEVYRDNQSEQQMSHVRLHDLWVHVDAIKGVSHNYAFKRQEIISILADLHLCDSTMDDYVPTPQDLEKKSKAESLEELRARVEETLDSFKDHDQYNDLTKEWETAWEHMSNAGFALCTHLVIIGRK